MTTPNRRIASFIQRIGYDFEYDEDQPDRWLVFIDTATSSFEVEIFLPNDLWIVFTSLVMQNVQGRNSHQFYELLLGLSHLLNGFKFGISEDGNYITVQAEWSQNDLNYEIFKGILSQFVYIYEDWYPQILQNANRMKLRSSSRHKGFEDRLSGFMDPKMSRLIGRIPQG